MHSSGRSKVGPQILLKECEICLKMLKMAILETQIFKICWGTMPPDCAFGIHCAPPPFESPGSTPAQVCLGTAEGKNLRALLPPHPSSYMYDAITLILQETLFFTPIILPIKTIFKRD